LPPGGPSRPRRVIDASLRRGHASIIRRTFDDHSTSARRRRCRQNPRVAVHQQALRTRDMPSAAVSRQGAVIARLKLTEARWCALSRRWKKGRGSAASTRWTAAVDCAPSGHRLTIVFVIIAKLLDDHAGGAAGTAYADIEPALIVVFCRCVGEHFARMPSWARGAASRRISASRQARRRSSCRRYWGATRPICRSFNCGGSE
jgi:hypothetical protein